jgi:hypothetical protein
MTKYRQVRKIKKKSKSDKHFAKWDKVYRILREEPMIKQAFEFQVENITND